jgi:lipopolysaccharide transport system ATP-binding protein
MFARMSKAYEAKEPQAESVADGPLVSGVAPERRKLFADRVAPLRAGSGEARITGITVVSSSGRETDTIDFDEEVRVRVFYRVDHKPPPQSAITMGITDRQGRQIIHFNSAKKGIYVSDADVGKEGAVEFSFRSNLCPGEYGLIGGIGPHNAHPQNASMTVISQVVDHCAGGSRFSVRFPDDAAGHDLWGVVHVPYEAREISVLEVASA